MHLEAAFPKTSSMYEFFENYILFLLILFWINFISTDFILDTKNVPNESDTKIHPLKSTSVFYSVILKNTVISELLKHLLEQN